MGWQVTFSILKQPCRLVTVSKERILCSPVTQRNGKLAKMYHWGNHEFNDACQASAIDLPSVPPNHHVLSQSRCACANLTVPFRNQPTHVPRQKYFDSNTQVTGTEVLPPLGKPTQWHLMTSPGPLSNGGNINQRPT